MAPPDFRGVAAAALRVAQDLVPRWLPSGRAEGNEWVAANPRRPSSDGGGAFRINLHTGAWADFAGTDKGGDLISLWAYLHSVGQWPACQAVAEQLGVSAGGSAPAAATPPPPTADERERARLIERDRAARTAADGASVSPAPADAPPVEDALYHFKHGQPHRHWIYRDAAGLVLMAVARWNQPTDTDPRAKEIMPLSLWRLPSGQLRWRWKGLPKPWPLYRLDELARRREATVVVCEGEKAADAAQVLLPEYVAITSPSGSKNAGKADWSPLVGRRVLVWPDHDAPGIAYADAVRAGLLDVGVGSVQVLSFAWVTKILAATRKGTDRADLAVDLAPGFDAADLVEAGARPEHVPPLELVDLPADDPPRPASVPAPSARERRPAGDRHAELVASINDAISRRGIEPDAADGWRRRDGGALVTVSLKELAADIWYDLLSRQELALGHVTDVLGVLAKRARQVRRASLVARFTGRQTTDAGRDALKAWVRMVTGGEANTDVRVMAHWLWLVKRLATDRRTEYDLMPIVFGEQGSGKSTATERLVAPLEELATTINASTLTDERRFRQLGVCLVGRWEEMQGAGRAEIESLKHTVTAHELNYRELATHSMVVLRRTMSFIGTSNNSVDVMVGDTTGARRFYQLTTPPRCDFALMDRIDCRQVWDAVSEEDRAPILEVIEVVRAAQATLVHRDAVSMWLDAEEWDKLTIRQVDSEEPLVVPAYNEAEGCPFEDLAVRFKHWCNEVGQSGIGVKMLAQRLKQEGWVQARPGTTGPRVRKFHKPKRPAPAPDAPAAEIAPDTPAAPERPPRGTRMASEPSPDEDVLGGGGGFAFD